VGNLQLKLPPKLRIFLWIVLWIALFFIFLSLSFLLITLKIGFSVVVNFCAYLLIWQIQRPNRGRGEHGIEDGKSHGLALYTKHLADHK
jgi:hypothetical protein